MHVSPDVTALQPTRPYAGDMPNRAGARGERRAASRQDVRTVPGSADGKQGGGAPPVRSVRTGSRRLLARNEARKELGSTSYHPEMTSPPLTEVDEAALCRPARPPARTVTSNR